MITNIVARGFGPSASIPFVVARGFAIGAAPVPPAPGAARIPFSLPRDPTLSNRYDPEARRFIDMLSGLVNSLADDGILVMVGPSQWALNTASDQFVLANRVLSPKAIPDTRGNDQAILSQQVFSRKGSYGVFGG